MDIVYANVRYFDDGNPTELRLSNVHDQAWMPLVSGVGKEILLPIVRNNIMPVNAPLIRRSTIEEVGHFDERVPPVEDWDYFIRCAVAGKRFHYADADGIRALVRTHPKSSSSDPRRMLRAEILMRETIRSLLKDEDVARLNEERLAEITGLLGVEEHTRAISQGRLAVSQSECDGQAFTLPRKVAPVCRCCAFCNASTNAQAGSGFYQPITRRRPPMIL